MTIYIDCSRVYVFGGNHGIPRVVRNLVNNLTNSNGYKIIPVVMSFGNFRPIKNIPFRSERILIFLKKIKSLIRYQKFTFSSLNKNRIKKGSSIIYDLFTINLLCKKRIDPKPGDIFVTLDNFLMSVFPEHINKLKGLGLKIGSMQHDLIPVRFGQFYPTEDIISFKSHLENSLRLSDICITVSDYVKSDLERYINENINNIKDINKNIKIDSYKHGYNIFTSKQDVQTPNTTLNQIFLKPTYIIVSTIEPRKNHSYLLDAFEKIWGSNIKANLLIIGKIGWMVDDLIKRIKEHKQYGKQLFMMNNVSDSELLYCYKNAKALITPSVTEGFGLPIIEALSQKTPVLASDIPVFREVGGDFCSYFSLSSPEQLAKIIIDWEKNGVKPNFRNINEFSWPTWKESTNDFIDKVISLCNKTKEDNKIQKPNL